MRDFYLNFVGPTLPDQNDELIIQGAIALGFYD